MDMRGKKELKAGKSSSDDSRWPLAEQEELRREVASMLHGNVQSALSACNVWLAMAEQLLAGAHAEAVETVFGVTFGDGGGKATGVAPLRSVPQSLSQIMVPESAPRYGPTRSAIDSLTKAESELSDARVTRRIVEAMSLLYKVRGEVERLRKAEVQRAVQTLYPTLINIGLRPALESLLDTLRLEGSVGDRNGTGSDQSEGYTQAQGVEHGVATDATHGAVNPAERHDAVLRGPALLAVQWVASESFMQWDHPTGDEELLNVRLELYRLLETVMRAAHAAFNVFYMTQAGIGADAPLAPEERHSLPVEVWLDVSEGVLRSLVHIKGGYGYDVDDKMFRFILNALPQRRFERAGGTVNVTMAAPKSGVQIAASLPIA